MPVREFTAVFCFFEPKPGSVFLFVFALLNREGLGSSVSNRPAIHDDFLVRASSLLFFADSFAKNPRIAASRKHFGTRLNPIFG